MYNRPDLDYPWDILDILEQQALELAHLKGYEKIEWRRSGPGQVGLFAQREGSEEMLIGFEGSLHDKDFSRARNPLPRLMVIPRQIEYLLYAVRQIETQVRRQSEDVKTGNYCQEFVRRYGKWLHDQYAATHAINRDTLIKDANNIHPDTNTVTYLLPGDIRQSAAVVATATIRFERWSRDGKERVEFAFAPEPNILYVRG